MTTTKLIVQTASVLYTGPDFLDVSLAGNVQRVEGSQGQLGGHRGIGLFFSPSNALDHSLDAKRAHFGGESDQEWLVYTRLYIEEMRHSYTKHHDAWTKLLSWRRVVLTCRCEESARCHRTVLARDVLTKLGANYRGEISE